MASSTTTTASKKIVQGTNLQNEAVQNASNQYVSDATKAAQQKADSYGSNPYANFQPSGTTKQAYKYWQDTLKNRPEDYTSKWGGTIDNLLNQIVNRKDFSYDFNADPLYQNYKDQYTNAGKQAMKDTIAQASSMTGGYGNSYATTAGSQAYQGYLQQLNDKIPELYNMAMNKYKMDTDTLMGKYNAVGSQEDRDFGQWNSKMGIWQNDRNYGLNAYSTLWGQDFQQNQFNYGAWNDQRNFDYQKYRDLSADDKVAYQNAYQAAKDAQQYEYQLNRDSIADDRYGQEWEYQKQRDKVADDHWAAEFALKQAAAARAGSKNGNNNNKPVSKDKTKTDDYKEAYNYAYYIVNNVAGEEGQNTAISYLTNLVKDPNTSFNAQSMNRVLEELGVYLPTMSESEKEAITKRAADQAKRRGFTLY